MRIAVMGAGGLGGYFGARLCLGGADVHFIARGKHLQALRDDGLRIVGPEPLHVARVNATDDAGGIGTADLVMLCVKLWDTEAALEQIRPLVGTNTTIVSFQNGVLKDQAVQAAYGTAAVMGGVGYVATTIERPGVIRQTGPMQRLLFGEFDGSRSPRGQAFLEACLAGGINAELSEDIQREIWQKFVFLAGLSGTTTTMRKPIGAIRELAQTRAFLLDVMREVVAVGRAQGVNLPEDYAEVRLKLADDVAYDMTSSMHHDLERGSPLEVRRQLEHGKPGAGTFSFFGTAGAYCAAHRSLNGRVAMNFAGIGRLIAGRPDPPPPRTSHTPTPADPPGGGSPIQLPLR